MIMIMIITVLLRPLLLQGMQMSTNGKCEDFIPIAKSIREEIERITLERYGKLSEEKRFGLYPCMC